MRATAAFRWPSLTSERVFALGAGVLVFGLLAFDARLLRDGDTLWHIRAGEWMIEHRAVPHTDIFSASMAGAPWSTHEWLAEIVMALAYHAGGLAGVVALTAASAGLTAAVLCAALQRQLGIKATLVIAALALACAAPNLLARPHVLALPLLTAWVAALFRAREQARAPALGWLALMAVWANLHGGFLIGLALAAFAAFEAVLEAPNWRTVRAWGVFGAGAGLAALATPHGIDGVLFPFRLMAMDSLAGIGEWRPIDFSRPQPIELMLAAGVIVMASRGLRAPLTRLVLVLALAHWAFQHTRHQMLFGVVAALAMARAFAPAFPRAAPTPLAVAPRRLAGVAAALAAAVLIIAGARLHTPLRLANAATSPVAALAHVPAPLKARAVFNDYEFGGYLIFVGVAPYIDSRADMYGDAFLRTFDAAVRGDRARAARIFADRDIAWTILSPRRPLVAALDAAPGWRRLYADDIAVVHVRDELRGAHQQQALLADGAGRLAR